MFGTNNGCSNILVHVPPVVHTFRLVLRYTKAILRLAMWVVTRVQVIGRQMLVI